MAACIWESSFWDKFCRALVRHKKTSWVMQNSFKRLKLLFLRELFQAIHGSQGETANCALYLGKSTVSQMLSA